MAIKNDQKGICWIDWPEELKDRHSKAVKEAEKELAEEILSPIAVLTCVAFVSKVPSFKAAEV